MGPAGATEHGPEGRAQCRVRSVALFNGTESCRRTAASALLPLYRAKFSSMA
jgi:hypothetical protein